MKRRRSMNTLQDPERSFRVMKINLSRFPLARSESPDTTALTPIFLRESAERDRSINIMPRVNGKQDRKNNGRTVLVPKKRGKTYKNRRRRTTADIMREETSTYGASGTTTPAELRFIDPFCGIGGFRI